MDSWSIEGDLRLDGAVCGAGGVWPAAPRALGALPRRRHGARMTVREIVTVGHPVLRQRADDVDPADIGGDEVQSLITDLIDTMRAANGAGIAANQIGVPRRVAVIEVNDNPRYPYKPPIPLTIVINPVIEPIDDETVEINEGCLSVPNLRGSVHRHVNIRVRWLR